MPKITPARPDAHLTHADSESEFAAGWCLPCYEAGSFTLTTDPASRVCLVHGALRDLQSAATNPQALASVPGGALRRSRPPRGAAARRPAPPGRPHERPRTARRAADRQLARAMAYGRRRAAARLASPGYTPHPGWRNFIASGWRVLVNQPEALAVIEALVEDQDWRTDKRAAWTAILRQLVCAMDWDTGLVAALTANRLGAAGARAPRTVSRVIAWARDIGLLVVVEHGASAEFLGTDHGRTPTYALVTNTPLPHPPNTAGDNPEPLESLESGQLTTAVEESGDPTESLVENKPLNGGRLEPTTPATPSWPAYRVPESAPERTAAARCLLERLGLDHGGVSRAPLWRTRALLKPWWDAGTCPAALLWAIDHHPDHPEHHRGDALRGTSDPLRVLGYRLQPWRGRLTELPSALTGVRGDYLATASSRAAEPADSVASGSVSTVRAAARGAVAEHLRLLRAVRRSVAQR